MEEEWGVSPVEFIDLKALMGDSSDNIPGVPGMGEKTATWIIQKYKSIEEAYAHAEDSEFKVPRKPSAGKDLKEHFELAKLSKELATINIHVPISLNFSDCKWENYANSESKELIRKWEFRSLYSRFEEAESTAEKKLSLPAWKDVEDPYLAKIAFKDAKKQKSAGIFLQADSSDGGKLYVYLCLSDTRLYRIPLSLCEEELTELLKEGEYFTLQLKDQYHLWEELLAGEIHDLSLGAYLLNPLKDSYAYDDLARDYMDLVLPGKKELQNTAEEGLYSAFVSWQAKDRIFQELKDTEQWELYRDVEEPLVPVLYRMEKAGILVDKEALLSYGEELKKNIAMLQEEIYSMAGEEFNINSPQQLGGILFEKMQLPGGKKTKTGYSTAVDVLEKLQEDYPIVGKILEYRTYSKLNSTYAEGLSNYVGEDQRIHGSFQQMVTATGRLSSTEPNLQNIPIRTEMGRVFRSVFIPKEGSVFLDADYSQVELRLLASLSKDEKLIEAYRKDADIHRVTASEVFHVPLEEVTPELRRNAKAVNFGIVYGISAFGLSEGLSISRQEAKEYIERYFTSYPKVKEYLDGEVAFAREHSFVKTLFGRRRPLPEIHASNFMRRSFSERVAMNAPIQGTAADIIKKAMVIVDQKLSEKNCQSRIVLQIHDELLLEVVKEELATVKDILVSAMEHVVSLPVPLIVEATVGNNWDEAH